jgi:hypothetical protein
MSQQNPPLRLSKSVRRRLLAVAKDQLRDPNQVLNLLLDWALTQRELLGFDLATLLKVNLSVLDDPAAASEPWNHVISGDVDEAPDGTFRRLVVR